MHQVESVQLSSGIKQSSSHTGGLEILGNILMDAKERFLVYVCTECTLNTMDNFEMGYQTNEPANFWQHVQKLHRGPASVISRRLSKRNSIADIRKNQNDQHEQTQQELLPPTAIKEEPKQQNYDGIFSVASIDDDIIDLDTDTEDDCFSLASKQNEIQQNEYTNQADKENDDLENETESIKNSVFLGFKAGSEKMCTQNFVDRPRETSPSELGKLTNCMTISDCENDDNETLLTPTRECSSFNMEPMIQSVIESEVIEREKTFLEPDNAGNSDCTVSFNGDNMGENNGDNDDDLLCFYKECPVAEYHNENTPILLSSDDEDDDDDENIYRPTLFSQTKDSSEERGMYICTCPKCGETFNESDGFKEHLKMHLKAELGKTTEPFETPKATAERRAITPKHDQTTQTSQVLAVTSLPKPQQNQQILTNQLNSKDNNAAVNEPPSTPPPAIEKNFVCSVCQKSYCYDWLLNMHMRVHNYERQNNAKHFNCSLCQKSFLNAVQLKAHKCNKRNVFRPFRCNYCSVYTKTEDKMLTHIRTFHSGGVVSPDTVKCPQCSLVLRKISFSEHLLTHSSERCYKCELCEFACKQKQSLNLHLKKRHADVIRQNQRRKRASKSASAEEQQTPQKRTKNNRKTPGKITERRYSCVPTQQPAAKNVTTRRYSYVPMQQPTTAMPMTVIPPAMAPQLSESEEQVLREYFLRYNARIIDGARYSYNSNAGMESNAPLHY